MLAKVCSSHLAPVDVCTYQYIGDICGMGFLDNALGCLEQDDEHSNWRQYNALAWKKDAPHSPNACFSLCVCCNEVGCASPAFIGGEAARPDVAHCVAPQGQEKVKRKDCPSHLLRGDGVAPQKRPAHRSLFHLMIGTSPEKWNLTWEMEAHLGNGTSPWQWKLTWGMEAHLRKGTSPGQ